MSKSTLVLVGGLLVLLGLGGLVVPTFFTHDTTDVAKVGDLKLQTQQTNAHTIPEPLCIGVFVVGVVIMATGLYRRA